MQRVLLAILLPILATTAALGQGQVPPTAEQVAIRAWNNVQGKLAAIAKDIPDQVLDYRPQKDTRSAREELWHMIGSNQVALARLKGEQVDVRKLMSNDGKPQGRAEIVAQLESSAKEVAQLLGQKFDPRIIGQIEHAGEHYGKLVTIYRVNGLVPPASRTE
jgi:hypothetical protein